MKNVPWSDDSLGTEMRPYTFVVFRRTFVEHTRSTGVLQLEVARVFSFHVFGLGFAVASVHVCVACGAHEFLILLGDDFWKMCVVSVIGSTVNARSCFTEFLTEKFPFFPFFFR